MQDKIYKKIPFFVHKHLSLKNKWAVSIPDNWNNYQPTTIKKMNLEDMGFHFSIPDYFEASLMEDYAFATKSDAKTAAKEVIEKYFKENARIWFRCK